MPGRCPIVLPELATRKLIEHWTPSTLLLFSVTKGLECLTRLGLRSSEDPWRKTARAAFPRSANLGQFTMAAFRMQVATADTTDDDPPVATNRAGSPTEPPGPLPSPGPEAISREANQSALSGALAAESRACREHLIAELAALLRTHRDLVGRRLDWRRRGVKLKRNDHVDLAVADVDDLGNLVRMTPYFESPRPTVDDPDQLIGLLIGAYNQARQAGARERPFLLRKCLRGALRGTPDEAQASKFLDRVLASTFVHFETDTSPERFQPPSLFRDPHLGSGALRVCCRLNPCDQEADMWLQVNHILVDGNPVAEFLNRLRQEWGTRGPTTVPAPSTNAWTAFSTEGDDQTTRIRKSHRFIDFGPLLRARRQLNDRYHADVGDITLVSLVVWGLAQQPTFRNSKIATAVDVPTRQVDSEERTITFVMSRPARFLHDGDRLTAFLRFQTDFNQQLHAARRRENAFRRAQAAHALAPVPLFNAAMTLLPRAVHDMCGDVCLTMIKNAEFFEGPAVAGMRAVIAVGNVQMAAENGETAGLVSIKSAEAEGERCLQAFDAAVARWEL